MILGVDFEKRPPIRRDTHDASTDRDSKAEPRPADASSSEPLLTSADAASDTSNGERLYVSMTEEGPSGDYPMTMQCERHGRWIPTKGETTITNEKAREARRNFNDGEGKEHETFSIASAEASPLLGEFCLSRRNADEVSWTIFLPTGKRSFLPTGKRTGGCDQGKKNVTE